MTKPTAPTGLDTRLVGWKRIANYLGCGERTARRWEQEEQLPVHRQHHEKRSTVYAMPGELDEWLQSRKQTDVENIATKGTGRLPVGLGVALLLVFAVMAAILLRPSDDSTDLLSADAKVDLMAVDLYDRGRALWNQRGESPNRRAIKLLTQATELDADYAQAWAALSSAWLTLPTYSDEVRSEDAIRQALLAADRAIALDPTLAEARSVMASVAQSQGDWLAAERIYRTALEVDPDNTSLLLWFAGHYRELGKLDDAFQLTDKAYRLDPNSPPILTEIGMNHHQVGRTEKGAEILDYLWLDLGVETPVVWIGRWFWMIEQRELENAAEWVALTPFRGFESELRLFVDYLQGSEITDSELSHSITTAYDNGLPSWLAYHMLNQSGLTDAALEILDRDSEDGDFDTSVVLFHVRGGSAHNDPRFADYVERLGYFDYWRELGPPDICRNLPQIPLCQRLLTPN